MKSSRKNPRFSAPWLEGTFWIVLSLIIAALAWQFADAPLPAPPESKAALPTPPVPVRPWQPLPSQPPTGDFRTLPNGPDGKVEIPEFVQLSRQLNRPDATASDDLDILHTLLGNYRRTRAWTGAPASENEEFIAPLLGENPLQLVFLAKNHSTLNDRGQLLDRWGSPYHFHSESADLLHIRSAGPDRIAFTDDDVLDGNSAAE